MRLPHFLRVTQTLALLGVAAGACGGAIESPPQPAADASPDDGSTYDGHFLGKYPIDGGFGVLDVSTYDGSSVGDMPIDP